MVMTVGLVMGLHAMFEIFVNGTEISVDIMMTYLPVSLLYIASMAMGYLGLRYIELSISSPICETAGQFAYIYAIADTEHLAMSAPIISSYCAASVLWSRIFLKEKLSKKHYLMIVLVVIGIAIMGFLDL